MSSREYELIKDEITVVMLSRDEAEDYGPFIPKIPMGDMLMAYKQVISNDEFHFITYSDLDRFGITATQLHKDAMENAQTHYPASVQSIEDTLGLPPNRSEIPTMYVVTNWQGEFGASAIAYPGMMDSLAEKIGGDFVILPSSVHEMLVVQTKGADLTKLEELLQQVNQMEVAPCDRLSDTAYCFDGHARMVMKASVYQKLQERDSIRKSSVMEDLKAKSAVRESPRPDLSRKRGREESL